MSVTKVAHKKWMIGAVVLASILAGSEAQAQTFAGRDHPNRRVPTQNPSENRMRIIEATSALPGFSNNAITTGGRVSLAGQVGVLNRDGLSRVELWQQLNGRWFLSQFLVVNHQGAEVGRIDTWTSDIYNRQRTRADKAWWTVLHYTTDPIRIMRTDPLPAQSVEISNYPRILTTANYPVSGVLNFDISSRAPSFGGSGAYSGSGFTANVASIPNPAHWVWQEAGNPAQSGIVTTTADFAINGAAIGSSGVTILPMMRISSNLPSSFVGNKANFPLAYVRADDVYPQSTLVLTITLPSGEKYALGNAGPFGGATTLTTFSHNWPLDLRGYLRDSGTYKVELWASTPVTESSALTPGVAAVNGGPGWEKVTLPVENIDVRFDVAATNLRIVTN